MIRIILNIYILVLIIDAVLSFLPEIRGKEIGQKIKFIADLTLKPIRKFLPSDLPFDLSPLIVIVGIKILMVIW